MSYRDPYAAGSSNNYNQNYQNNPAAQYNVEPIQEYSDVSYTRQQAYGYNPASQLQEHTRQNSGYQDERYRDQDDYTHGEAQPNYNYPPMQRQPTTKTIGSRTMSQRTKKQSVSVTVAGAVDSGFEQGEFTPQKRPRTARALRDYRIDHQGKLWGKGGRGRTAGRFCFCTLMTTLFLIISIALSLALWVRPPKIKIGDVQTMTQNGSPIQQLSDGVQINLGVDIAVWNPNYFSVDFKQIQAEIFYPIENTPVGGGIAREVIIGSNAQTNFTFPFALSYRTAEDPNGRVIVDIGSKCGVGGRPKSNIDVRYKITLSIRILMITISPVIEDVFSIFCPLQPSDVTRFIGGGF